MKHITSVTYSCTDLSALRLAGENEVARNLYISNYLNKTPNSTEYYSSAEIPKSDI